VSSRVVADVHQIVFELLSAARSTPADDLFETLGSVSYSVRENGCYFLPDDPAFNVAELGAFRSFARRIKDQKLITEFAILDYWLPSTPKSYINAIYLALATVPDHLQSCAARLTSLYKAPDIDERIFDTNKIISDAKRYSPFILARRPLPRVLPGNDYYVNLNELSRVLEEVAPAGVSRLQAAPLPAFANALIAFYDECHRYTDRSLIENAIARSCSPLVRKALLRAPTRDVDDRHYDDVISAFLTYLAFFLTIVPPTAKADYIYFPARLVAAPENKLHWVGGILLPFKRHVSRDVRVAFEGASQAIVSSFYSGFSDGLLIQSLRRSAQAQIMSRNMSHNIGSHALARISAADIARSPEDTERLFEYLQERMDFIARVATEWPTWREPVLFFGDLLRGFFRQGLLLDNLIADDGYRGEHIEFLVKLPTAEEFLVLRYKASERDTYAGNVPAEFRMAKEDGATVDDVLVAIPGGPVGRQAFYGLLENAIRNAAKHNRGDQRLRVLIELCEEPTARGERCYSVRVQDSLSRIDPRGRLVADVRKHLETDLVNAKTRKPVSEGWGMQEMKVYANYLRHRVDHGSDRARDMSECRGLSAEAEGFGASSFLPEAGPQVLTLRFGLQRPQVATIVGGVRRPGDLALCRRYGLEFVHDTLSNAALTLGQVLSPGLMYVATGESDEALLDALQAHERVLPPRVLVRPSDPSSGVRLRATLRHYGLSQRFRVDCSASMDSDSKSESEIEVQRYIVDLQCKWLVALAEERGFDHPFNIIVYFDRDVPHFSQRWADLGADVKAFGLESLILVFPMYRKTVNDCVNSDVVLVDAWRVLARSWNEERGELQDRVIAPSANGTWIVYDNHRRGIPGDVEPRFECYIGSPAGETSPLPNNREVFDRLANVPRGFVGVLSLLQLVEASLLRVLILDERIAGNVLQVERSSETDGATLAWKTSHDMEVYGDALAEHLCKAGICFVPFVNVDVGGEMRRLSVLRATGTVRWPFDETSKSGITIRNSELVECVVIDVAGGGQLSLTAIPLSDHHAGPHFDVVVIHVGLLEWLATSAAPFEQDAFLKSLRRLGARVILTSGRGAQVGTAAARYPFIEFAVLESYLARELSKPSLGNVLMAVAGQRMTDGSSEGTAHRY
jgi:hypothetical protein